MEKVRFNVGSNSYMVSFPDDVKVRYYSSCTGDSLPYFFVDDVPHPITDVLSGDFDYQVDDLSPKKKSIYCNDEEFSVAKYVIDMLRRADKGLFSSTRILTFNDHVLTASVRPDDSDDFIV